MNLEELKLILEVVKAVGEGAFAITIIYFVKSFLQFLIGFGCLATVIILTFKLFNRSILIYQFGSKICQLFNKDIYLFSDREQVLEIISELRNKEKVK